MNIPVGFIRVETNALKTVEAFRTPACGYILRRKPIPRISKRRRADLRLYGPARAEFLRQHPLCQITLAILRIDEREALEAFESWTQDTRSGSRLYLYFRGEKIPFANQIHHRNKSNGSERFLNQDYWMAASEVGHRWAEDKKDQAREIGILLPINAKPDGTLPDGSRCLTTPELLKVRAAR